MIYAVDIMTA